MGLQFLASVLISFLDIAFIFAILHCDGNVSSFITGLKILAKWITGALSFRNLLEVL